MAQTRGDLSAFHPTILFYRRPGGDLIWRELSGLRSVRKGVRFVLDRRFHNGDYEVQMPWPFPGCRMKKCAWISFCSFQYCTLPSCTMDTILVPSLKFLLYARPLE